MSNNTSILFLMTSLLVLASAGPSLGQQPLKVGERFPALTLPSLETGEPMSVDDFRGQRLILMIFASW